MAYRSIETKIWQDSKFKKLDVNCKLVFVYLITNIHTHYCGLYYIPIQLIGLELDMPFRDVDAAINNLISTGFIKYDNSNSVVWVINMTKYQCKSSQVKLIIGIHHYLEGIDSTLVNDYFVYYNNILDSVSIR